MASVALPLPRSRPLWRWLGVPETSSHNTSDFADDISISSSLEAEISSTIAPSEAGENSVFFDPGPSLYLTRGLGEAMSALKIDGYDRDTSLLGAGRMFDDLSLELDILSGDKIPTLMVSQYQSPMLNPVKVDAPALPCSSTFDSLPRITPLQESFEAEHEDKTSETSSGKTGTMILPKESDSQRVFTPLVITPCEFDKDEYYKEDDRAGNGITGSETEISNVEGTKGSRETDSTFDSSASVDIQRKILISGDIDLSHMNPGGQSLDRLALCFTKETIELFGKTMIMPQQQATETGLPNPDDSPLEKLSSTSSNVVDKIEQGQVADVSTLKSTWEVGPASSKTPSSDETECEDWLSDLVEEDPYLDASHPFLKHELEMVVCALRLFRRHLQGNRCPAGPNDGDSKSSNMGGSSLTSTSSAKNGRKRSSKDGGPGDDNENGDTRDNQGDRQGLKKPRVGGSSRPRHLACLFYKRNKLQHLRCLHLQLKRVRDVKQHLWRCHHQPRSYCPVCFEVFDGDMARDTHVRQRTCQPRDRPNWDGVSEAQRSLLHQRVASGDSLEEQWFSVWDIVFPSLPRPSSPFLGNAFEETIEMFREFWDISGQQVISTVLGRHGLLNWTRQGEERDLAIAHPQIMHSAFTVLVDEFSRAVAPIAESRTFGSEVGTADSNSVDPQVLLTPPPSTSSSRPLRSVPERAPVLVPTAEFNADNQVTADMLPPEPHATGSDITSYLNFDSSDMDGAYVSDEARQVLEEGGVFIDWNQETFDSPEI